MNAISLPAKVSCNPKINRHILSFFLIVAIFSVLKILGAIECHECSTYLSSVIYFAYFGFIVIFIFLIIMDKPADITIHHEFIDVIPIRILGITSNKPVRRSLTEFDHLAIKGGLPVLGGMALRIVFRGKPGYSDVAFDPPEEINGTNRISGLPDIAAVKDYWRQLGAVLEIRVLDDVWGSGPNG